MPLAHVSRAFLERSLGGGPVGAVYIGVPPGHFGYRRDATATTFAA
jgi:hypothetical protein